MRFIWYSPYHLFAACEYPLAMGNSTTDETSSLADQDTLTVRESNEKSASTSASPTTSRMPSAAARSAIGASERVIFLDFDDEDAELETISAPGVYQYLHP